MANKFFWQFVAILPMFSSAYLGAGQVNRPDEVIRFPDLHMKHHLSSGKGEFKDIEFGGNNVLWMIDDQYLWRWNYLTSSLKRIDLAKNKQLNLQSIARIDKDLLVFADQVFYLIDIDTLKIRRVANPSHGRQGPIWQKDNNLFWSDKASAWQFDVSQRKLKRIAPLAGIRKNDIVYHSSVSGITFIARQNLIVSSQNIKGKVQQKILHKSLSNIEDIFVDSVENIYFVSKDAVMRLKSSGEIIQVIPTVKQKIAAALIVDHLHLYYLAQSQTIESYDVVRKVKTTLQVPVTHVQELAVKKDFIAALTNGRPEIFYSKNF